MDSRVDIVSSSNMRKTSRPLSIIRENLDDDVGHISEVLDNCACDVGEVLDNGVCHASEVLDNGVCHASEVLDNGVCHASEVLDNGVCHASDVLDNCACDVGEGLDNGVCHASDVLNNDTCHATEVLDNNVHHASEAFHNDVRHANETMDNGVRNLHSSQGTELNSRELRNVGSTKPARRVAVAPLQHPVEALAQFAILDHGPTQQHLRSKFVGPKAASAQHRKVCSSKNADPAVKNFVSHSLPRSKLQQINITSSPDKSAVDNPDHHNVFHSGPAYIQNGPDVQTAIVDMSNGRSRSEQSERETDQDEEGLDRCLSDENYRSRTSSIHSYVSDQFDDVTDDSDHFAKETVQESPTQTLDVSVSSKITQFGNNIGFNQQEVSFKAKSDTYSTSSSARYSEAKSVLVVVGNESSDKVSDPSLADLPPENHMAAVTDASLEVGLDLTPPITPSQLNTPSKTSRQPQTDRSLDSEQLVWKQRVRESRSFSCLSDKVRTPPPLLRSLSMTNSSSVRSVHSSTVGDRANKCSFYQEEDGSDVLSKQCSKTHFSTDQNVTAVQKQGIEKNTAIQSSPVLVKRIYSVVDQSSARISHGKLPFSLSSKSTSSSSSRRPSAVDQPDLRLLEATATRLNLPTRRLSTMVWREQNLDNQAFLSRLRSPGKSIGEGLRANAEQDFVLTAERKDKINESLSRLRQDLVDIRLQDQALAHQFLSIRHAMNSLRLAAECEGHQELLQDAEEDIEELRELSRLVDIPPELLSPYGRLKNVGITRMNISARRFSTC